MSLFKPTNKTNKRSWHTRGEIRDALKNDTGFRPSSTGRKWTQRQRKDIVDRVLGSRFGSRITEKDYQKAIRGLDKTSRDRRLGKEERIGAERTARLLRRQVQDK